MLMKQGQALGWSSKSFAHYFETLNLSSFLNYIIFPGLPNTTLSPHVRRYDWMPGNYSITGDLMYDWKKYFDVSCENDTIPTWNQVYRMYIPLKSKDYERNRYSPKVFFGRKGSSSKILDYFNMFNSVFSMFYFYLPKKTFKQIRHSSEKHVFQDISLIISLP